MLTAACLDSFWNEAPWDENLKCAAELAITVRPSPQVCSYVRECYLFIRFLGTMLFFQAMEDNRFRPYEDSTSINSFHEKLVKR